MSDKILYEVHLEEGPCQSTVTTATDKESLKESFRETVPDKYDIVFGEIISHGEYRGREHYNEVMQERFNKAAGCTCPGVE